MGGNAHPKRNISQTQSFRNIIVAQKSEQFFS